MSARNLPYHLIFASIVAGLLVTPFAFASNHKEKEQLKIKTYTINPQRAFTMQNDALKQMMLNLYTCNPQALQKNTQVSKEEYVAWVFEGPFDWKFDAIRKLQSIAALELSLNQDYHGDRILPLITGLHTMLLQAYGGQTEYRFNDKLNFKSLDIASKNIHIVATRLPRLLDESSQPYLNDNCQKTALNALYNLINAIPNDPRIETTTALKSTRIRVEESTSDYPKSLDFIPF